MELVEYGVPGGVELSNGVVIFKREVVAAAVASWEIGVHTTQGVHGLVHISKRVDQKTESIGLSSGLVVIVVLHDSSVCVTGLVAAFVGKPVNDVGDVLCDVVHVLLEVGVVLQVAALVEVRDVHEVPVGLPAATLVLDLVGERGALHEWVLVFTVGNGLASHC